MARKFAMAQSSQGSISLGEWFQILISLPKGYYLNDERREDRYNPRITSRMDYLDGTKYTFVKEICPLK